MQRELLELLVSALKGLLGALALGDIVVWVATQPPSGMVHAVLRSSQRRRARHTSGRPDRPHASANKCHQMADFAFEGPAITMVGPRLAVRSITDTARQQRAHAARSIRHINAAIDSTATG